jgi:LysR family nitrogen assimilation transcriptional regulator
VEATQIELKALKSGLSDHVVLGIPPSLMMLLGPELLIEARDVMAGVSLSLVEERSVVLLDALDREQINVTFAWNVSDRTDLERIALLEEDLLLVTAPENAPAAETVSLAEALAHDLVIAGERGVIRNIVEAQARRLGLHLRLAFEVHSVTSMKALIGRGGAATIMPYSLAPKELSSGELVGRRIDRPVITRTLYRVRPLKRLPFAKEALIEEFLEGLTQRLLAAMGTYARPLR